jgi:hypothetical protein
MSELVRCEVRILLVVIEHVRTVTANARIIPRASLDSYGPRRLGKAFPQQLGASATDLEVPDGCLCKLVRIDNRRSAESGIYPATACPLPDSG